MSYDDLLPLVPPVRIEKGLDVCDATDADVVARGKRGPQMFKTGRCEHQAEWAGLSIDDPPRLRKACDRHKELVLRGEDS